MITIIQKVLFPEVSAVLLLMKDLDFPAFRACAHRLCGLFSRFGLPLELRHRSLAVFRLYMGPVRPRHSLLGHLPHLRDIMPGPCSGHTLFR